MLRNHMSYDIDKYIFEIPTADHGSLLAAVNLLDLVV